MKPKSGPPRTARLGRTADSETQAILRHWQEAVPNDRLAHLVKDAIRAMLRSLSLRLNEYSVSIGHWSFLRILWEKDGLTQRELSVQAGVMEPTTHSALNAMEKLGYITRRRLPDDRKKMYVFLTPKGRLLKSKLVPFAEEVNEIAVRGVSAADIAATRRTLLAVIENIARDDAGTPRKSVSTRAMARLVSSADSARKRA
jgi:DNA-binding MarR family transcriptional regulator